MIVCDAASQNDEPFFIQSILYTARKKVRHGGNVK